MISLRKSRTFVIGDMHGAYRALKQCLQAADFNYAKDTLICLGDVCDGYPEVNLCFNELLKVKNLVFVLGNHDEMALKWAISGREPIMWTSQGGSATVESYPNGMPEKHVQLLIKARSYYEKEKRLFVHAGLKPGMPIKKQEQEVLVWDRSLVLKAISTEKQNGHQNLTGYNEVYVGHTPTINYKKTNPFQACEIWLMDTGAGWGSKLSMMDIHTKQVYQSAEVSKLYPNVKGRR
jgi:serine/threonine protein phosphatase 1